MKRGVSYAPCLHEKVVPLDFLDEAIGVSVDLTTGTAMVLGAGSRKAASQISPFSLDFRWEADLLTFGVVAEGGARNGTLVKTDRESELPSGFSNRLEHVAFADSFQRIQHDVRRNVGYEKRVFPGGLTVYALPEETSDPSLKWTSRLAKRIRVGPTEDKWLLFKIDDRFGLFTECFVEYGNGLETPVLHLKWLFNLEPGKDWFDTNGVPVRL